MNVKQHISAVQKAAPKSLTFSGIISAIIKKGSDATPHDAIKMMNEKLTIGIQLTDSTWYCHDFSIIYMPNEIKPTAIPTDDIANKN